jgi:hypothetical protein
LLSSRACFRLPVRNEINLQSGNKKVLTFTQQKNCPAKLDHLTGLFAVTVIWTKFKGQGQKQSDGLYYLVGGAILIQSLLYLNITADSGRYGELINYVLVGLIGTIKLKDIEFKYSIDKLLNIYFLYGLTFIIWDTTKLIK